MAMRHWREFPERLIYEFNGTGGLVGLAGLILAIVALPALNLLSGQMALTLGAIGVIFGISAIIIAVCKAIPEKLVDPADIVMKRQPLANLETLDTGKLRAVAVVGLSYGGKSTLI